MAVANDAPRKYRSPLRQEQASRTRSAVLDAAGELFVTRGFGATTMKDIAAQAAVSVESVYAQGSKSSLLLACVDRAIVGDDTDQPLIERTDMQVVLTDPDVRARLAALREMVVRGAPASAPIFEAFRAAAAADPKMADQWRTYDRRRYEDCERMVEAFRPFLRPGLPFAEAVDVYYALVSPATVQMFIGDRRWPAERFAEWLVDSVQRLLLARTQEPSRKAA